MTARMTANDRLEAQLEGNHNRRMANQARTNWDRYDRQWDAADALVGHLQRETGLVYYINVLSRDGRYTGAIREFKSAADARSFLIRNGYV